MLLIEIQYRAEGMIYKRKQESKKPRKHEKRKNDNGQEKKKEKLSYFLDRFLGPERVCLLLLIPTPVL